MDEIKQEEHVCTEDCKHETDIDFVAPKVKAKVKAPAVEVAQEVAPLTDSVYYFSGKRTL